MSECVKTIIYKFIKDYEGNNEEDTLSILKAIISKNIEDKNSIRNYRRVESFYKWAKYHNKLKVVSWQIPSTILPPSFKGQLHDIKVFTKHGPDDAVYDGNEDIRKKVARGNCILELESENDEEVIWLSVVYALKKFTGGLGDDDDRDYGDNQIWKKYFYKPVEDSNRIVCTKKANGEAAHLSAINIQDTIYLCAGSKNVHVLFKSKDDIALYSGDRFKIAKEVAETVWQTLQTLPENARELLMSFMATCQVTAVFEILHPEHQHVVDLSYLPSPQMVFVTWTSNIVDDASEELSLCWLPPDVGINLARRFGLSTVEYDLCESCDVEDRLTTIRRGYHYEGEVLYFLDADDNVIGLLKKKTSWYVVCRAIREKVRFACQQQNKDKTKKSRASYVQKINGRLNNIQKWLCMSTEAIQQWKKLGSGFLDWCFEKLDSDQLTAKHVAEQFPVNWLKFLDEKQCTDNIAPF